MWTTPTPPHSLGMRNANTCWNTASDARTNACQPPPTLPTLPAQAQRQHLLKHRIRRAHQHLPTPAPPPHTRFPHSLGRRNAYTCWNTASGARTNNYGSRIDLLLAANGGSHGSVAQREWIVDGVSVCGGA
eukprot:365694-Chlamydomonas_euryale.AAC.13